MIRYRSIRPGNAMCKEMPLPQSGRYRSKVPTGQRDIPRLLEETFHFEEIRATTQTRGGILHVSIYADTALRLSTLTDLIAILAAGRENSILQLHLSTPDARVFLMEQIETGTDIIGEARLYSLNSSSLDVIIDPKGMDTAQFAQMSSALDLAGLRPEYRSMSDNSQQAKATARHIDALLMEAGIFKEHGANARKAIWRILDSANKNRPFAVISAYPPLDEATTDWPEETFDVAREREGETIIEFLRRVWKPLIDKGATLKDLRRDDTASDAVARLRYQAKRSGEPALPPDLNLMSSSELNAELAAQSAELDFATVQGLYTGRRRRRHE